MQTCFRDSCIFVHRLRRDRATVRCHVVHDRCTAAVRRRHDGFARVVVHLRTSSTVPAVVLPPEPLVGCADIHCSASSLGNAATVAHSVRV